MRQGSWPAGEAMRCQLSHITLAPALASWPLPMAESSLFEVRLCVVCDHDGRSAGTQAHTEGTLLHPQQHTALSPPHSQLLLPSVARPRRVADHEACPALGRGVLAHEVTLRTRGRTI